MLDSGAVVMKASCNRIERNETRVVHTCRVSNGVRRIEWLDGTAITHAFNGKKISQQQLGTLSFIFM